jgi:hypothetical protein
VPYPCLVPSNPVHRIGRHRSPRYQFGGEARHRSLARHQSTTEERVHVMALWRPFAVLAHDGKCVPVQHDHVVEVPRERLCRQESAHAAADDDSLAGRWRERGMLLVDESPEWWCERECHVSLRKPRSSGHASILDLPVRCLQTRNCSVFAQGIP